MCPGCGPCALAGGAALAVSASSSGAKILFLRSQMARARNSHDPGWILSNFKYLLVSPQPNCLQQQNWFLVANFIFTKWDQLRKHQWMQMRKEKTSAKLIKRKHSFDLLFFCLFFSCVFCQGGVVSPPQRAASFSCCKQMVVGVGWGEGLNASVWDEHKVILISIWQFSCCFSS